MTLKMQRIIVHWTGGSNRASGKDKEHYHRITEGDGSIVFGNQKIADNVVTTDGDYAAHTLRLNTGSIGVALAGMRDAIEHPFSPGPSPITEDQFFAACRMIADLCLEHGIPVTPQTVLTHAEVEPTLGVKQRGKWDIARLPWRDDIRGAISVGDYMRGLVIEALGFDVGAQPRNRPILRIGDHGVAVAELQTDLADLGYFSGRIDGQFGTLTRASVLAFQADNRLATDGSVGPHTWATLAKAPPRPPRQVSMEQIDEASGTAGDARMTARVGDVIGIGAGATMIAEVNTAAEQLEESAGTLTRISEAVVANWPLALLCAACVVCWLALRAISHTTRQRRLRDAREHRSLAR